MMKTKDIIIACLAVLCAVLGGVLLYTCRAKKPTETRVVVDTVKYLKPIPKDSVVRRYVFAKLPVVKSAGETPAEALKMADTIIVHDVDSVRVQIPITQKHYSDERYDAWVSGYMPALDSLQVYDRTILRTETKYKSHRYSVGLSAGYGVGKNGFSPFIGIGVSVNLFSFK